MTTSIDCASQHLFALARLLQLVSPSLPIGAFTYSQGIEWAVEAGWIKDRTDLAGWIEDQLVDNLAHLDIPVLGRLYAAGANHQTEDFAGWTDVLLAHRETAELRAEERQRGRALADLLISLGVPFGDIPKKVIANTQLGGFALAAQYWQVELETTALGYAWAWLENLALAAVKIIPLGQTAGQQVIHDLAVQLPQAVRKGLSLVDSEIGSSLPALAIASSRHETQYTRLFRS